LTIFSLFIPPFDDIPYKYRVLFEENEDAIDINKLISTVTSNTSWWYKKQNNEKIETEIQNMPAIIAFQHGNGRVVLSGPHIANNITTDKNAEIIDMYNPGFLKNSGKLGVNISEGLYHWKSGDSWLDYSDLVYNEDLYWY